MQSGAKAGFWGSFKGVNLTRYSKMWACAYGCIHALQGDGTSLGGLSFELLLPEGLLMAIAAICYGMYILCLSSALFYQNTRD
jgi:hypothetical protein